VRIYSIIPADIASMDFYKQTIYSHAKRIPCSERRVAYSPFVCAGLIASQVKNYILKRQIVQEILFDLEKMDFYKTPGRLK